MTHNDLNTDFRLSLEASAIQWADALAEAGQSLAIAREAWINAFDKAADELDSTVAKEAEVG